VISRKKHPFQAVRKDKTEHRRDKEIHEEAEKPAAIFDLLVVLMLLRHVAGRVVDNEGAEIRSPGP